MKNFVKLIQQAHTERFSVVLNKAMTKKIPVAFLSLSPVAQAVDLAKKIRGQGLHVVTIFVRDPSPPPVNIDFDVVHLSQAAQVYPQPEYIFTADISTVDTRVAIKCFPASKVISITNTNDEFIYETFMAHLDDLREVYESLIDEESKKTFCGYWLAKISNQLSKVVYSNSAHYLINGFVPERGAIVIDGGAFDGGTTTVFTEMGYKVYGFEIDRMNYERALKIAEENNFVVENLGLGSYKHKAHYNLMGSGSQLTERGTETVQITTLDAYVRENNLPRVDFIKLDVEGAELDVLKGAKTTIVRFKPILALSAYHKLDDFWTLMNFVKSIRPDYKFAMRQSYETPEEEPANFTDGVVDYLIGLGLEPVAKGFGECVLFAR